MLLHSNALLSNLLQDLSKSFPDTDFEVGVEEWPGITPRERQATALLHSILKKFKDLKNEDADAKALEIFLASNMQCKDWELRLNNSGEEVLFGEFRMELWKFFTNRGYSIVPNIAGLSQLGMVGPGASIGATGKDFYSKLFSSRHTCTSKGLELLYKHYVCNSSTYWSRAEQARDSEYGGADIVAGNKLSFVDKKRDVSRVICTEPSLNMFFQLGLGDVLTRRLANFFGIDLQEQPFVNRELARVGSLTDSLSTIDLSAASDSVSLKMLRASLPADIVSKLEFLRSPTVTLPCGKVEELHMVSSMGNGFTFPLETIVFACVVSAVYRTLGIPLVRTKRSWAEMPVREFANRCYKKRRYGDLLPEEDGFLNWDRGNFGVFGDDIIVTKEATARVVRLLNILGFQVNTEKSFTEGPFRESCGADYFDGLPTRGVYIKSLKTQQSRYVAINRLNEWSAVTGIPVPKTVQYLMKGTRKLYVPLHENDDAGIKVPSRIAETLGCKTRGRPHDATLPIYGTVKYRAWLPKVSQLRFDDVAGTVRGTGKPRMFNEDAMFLAYLRGDIINGRSGVRTTRPRYHTKWTTTLYWDRVLTAGKQFPVGTTALAKATTRNIMSG